MLISSIEQYSQSFACRNRKKARIELILQLGGSSHRLNSAMRRRSVSALRRSGSPTQRVSPSRDAAASREKPISARNGGIIDHGQPSAASVTQLQRGEAERVTSEDSAAGATAVHAAASAVDSKRTAAADLPTVISGATASAATLEGHASKDAAGLTAQPDNHSHHRHHRHHHGHRHRRLHHREEVLAHPHSRKNKFMSTGYRLYEAPSQAWADAFAITNETANVWTALLGLATAGYVAWAAAQHEDILQPNHAWWLMAYAAAAAANALLVAFYHLFCPYPAWYDAASAADLFAIVLVALASEGASHFIPGSAASVTALAAADAGRAAPGWGHAALRAVVAPVAEAIAGRHLPTPTLAYCFWTSWVVLVGGFATVRRIFTPGETPLPLLLGNFVPLLWNVLDMTVSSPRRWSFLAAALLFFGGGLYAGKLPERLLKPAPAPETETAAGASVADASTAASASNPPESSKTVSAATAIAVVDPATQLVPVAPAQHTLRLIDIVGHSHMIHHLCYTATLLIAGSDFVYLAVRAGCTAAAAGGEAELLTDPRCAAVLG